MYSRDAFNVLLGAESPWDVHVFEQVTSTMDVARELAERYPERNFIAAVAQTQTAGLGRHTRRWVSPPEGLWMTLVLRPRIAREHAVQAPLLAAVAVAQVLAAQGFLVGIKWPNDILATDSAHYGKKLCGIRAEVCTKGISVAEEGEGAACDGSSPWISLGIGLNVNQTSFDESIAGRAVSLCQIAGGIVHSRTHVACALLRQLELLCAQWEQGGFASIRKQWLAYAFGMGQPALVQDGGRKLEGIIAGLDEDGHLLLELPGQETLYTVLSGDLVCEV